MNLSSAIFRRLSKRRQRSIVISLFLTIAACAPSRCQTTTHDRDTNVWNQSFKVVDLTHAFDDRTIYWPNAERFELTRGPAGITERGYFYAANKFAAAEHGGTHLDAPIHFFEGGQTTDRVPVSRLVGEAALIDVRDKCSADRDYQIGVDDLRAWEVAHGRTLTDTIVLLFTGFATRWPDAESYLGTSERGEPAVTKLHFPGLDPIAAEWLTEHRGIKAIGIDTASIDHGPTRQFPSHVTLCKHNVPILENIADMNELPPVGALVIALPMKIADGSGGPARIIALVPVSK